MRLAAIVFVLAAACTVACVGSQRPSERPSSNVCGSCPAGTVCEGGQCLAVCQRDADCTRGTVCRGGVCVCTDAGGSTLVCENGEVCCDGQGCFESGDLPSGCDVCTPECAEGEDCVQGVCSCGGGAACGPGEVCVSGACRCGAWPACVDGICCGDACCPTGRVCCQDTWCEPGATCEADGCEMGDCDGVADGNECGSRFCDELEWHRWSCVGEVCSQTVLLEDCDDNNECTMDTCEPAPGCDHSNHIERTACGAGWLCRDDGQCVECISWDDCDDENECTIDVCELSGDCSHTPVAEGEPCEDTRVCNDSGTCVDCLEPADCGVDGDFGDTVCSGGNIRQPVRTWACDDNVCSYTDSDRLAQNCPCGCRTTTPPSCIGYTAGVGQWFNYAWLCDQEVCKLAQECRPICGSSGECNPSSANPWRWNGEAGSCVDSGDC